MKKLILGVLAVSIVITGAVMANSAERTAFSAISRDFDEGNISADIYVENLIYSVKAPELLDAEYRGLHPGRSGTLPLVEAFNHIEEVSEETRDRLRPMFSRPWGLSETYGTTHFLLHYTTSGGDATSPTFVSQMATAFEDAWTHLATTRGFDEPPSDGSGGGDGRYDIYIRNLSTGILGYCEPEATVPSTPWNDATSFINMRNSYTAYSPTPINLMKMTAVHELFHAFQFGYDVGEASWFMEVSSVWVEDDKYPTYNEEHGYYDDVFFDNPDVTITTYNGEHEYGSYILGIYFTEKWGVNSMREIWEQCRYVNIFSAIQAVASDNGSSRNESFSEFFVWNLFTGSRSAAGEYPEANLLPNIHIEDVVYSSDYPVTGGTSSHWPDHLASNYFELKVPSGASGPFSVTFDGEDGGVWSAQLVFPTPTSFGVMDIPLDTYGYGYLTIEDSVYSGFSELYLVVGMLSISGTDWHFSYSAAFDTIVGSYNPPRNLVATSGLSGQVPLEWDPPIGGGTGGEEEIYYDDGTGTGYIPPPNFHSGTLEFVRFTYAAPCTLITGKFQVYSSTTPYGQVLLRVFGESGDDWPGAEIGTGRLLTPETMGTWTEYDLSVEHIALPAGDFFIGIERVGDEPGVLIDSASTIDRSRAIVDDSLGYTVGGDYLIRAIVKAGSRLMELSPYGPDGRRIAFHGSETAISSFTGDFEGYIEPVELDEPLPPPSHARPTETPTNYNVYRSLTNGGPWLVPIASPTTEEWTDLSVSDGTTYYYIVKAQYAGGESGPSNQVSATPGATGDTSAFELIINADTAATSLMLYYSDGWAEVLNVDRPAQLLGLYYWIYTEGTCFYWPGIHHWADNRIVGELLPHIEEPCGGASSDTGWAEYIYNVEPYGIYVNGDFAVSMRQVTGNEYIIHEDIPSTGTDFMYNDSLDFWYQPDTGVFFIGAIVEYVDSTLTYSISGCVNLAGGTGGSPPPSDLSGSLVSIQSLGIVETTDASGHFVIDSVQPGTYIVTANRIWYDPQNALVPVGSDVTQNFNLIPLNLPVNPPRFVAAASFHDGEVPLNWLGPVGSPGTNQWIAYWEPDSMYWYRSRLPMNSVECTRFDIWAPCTLKNVRIAFYDSVGIYDNVEFHIWADDGSGYPNLTDDLITPIMISPTPYSPTYGIQFTYINIDSLGCPVTVLPGEQVHIGVKHLTEHPSVVFDNSVPVDAPTPSKIYDASSGMWTNDMADFLMEAYVEYFEYAGRPSPEIRRPQCPELRAHGKFASAVPAPSLPSRLRPMEGTTVDFYDIYWTDDISDTTSFTLIASVPGDSNNYTDRPVTNDMWHYYYIKTHQAHGISERSAIVMAYPKANDDTAHVLLVDDDGSSWAGGIDESWAYIQALLDAGIAFNGIDLSNPWDSPLLGTLSLYDAVIWFTGILYSDSLTLSSTDEANLATYLTGGGNLALFAQDYLWDRYASGFTPSDFPAIYFDLDSAYQDAWQISSSVSGLLSGYVGGLFDGMDFAVSSPFGNSDLWPDYLYADSNFAWFEYGTTNGPTICGKTTAGYKTVFSTIPLAALIDGMDPATREEFMRRILLDYFSIIGPANVDVTYTMSPGWHMTSLPLDLPDKSAATVFPGTATDVYLYNPTISNYETVDSIIPGYGYFVLYTGDTSFTHNGPPISSFEAPLETGWNMVGSIYADSTVPFADATFTPDYFLSGNFYAFDGSGYISSTGFDPGEGYWVLVSSPCTLSLGSSGRRRIEPERKILTLDFEGTIVEIGIGENTIGHIPPATPFGSGPAAYLIENGERCLKVIKETGEWELVAERNGIMRYRNPGGVKYILRDDGENLILSGEGDILLKAGEYTITAEILPEKYGLHPAIPNPFNARTILGFDIPEDSDVRLIIYDISGRQIRTLVDKQLPAGSYKSVWDGISDSGAEQPSGVYLYRIATDTGFSETRRMLLIK